MHAFRRGATRRPSRLRRPSSRGPSACPEMTRFLLVGVPEYTAGFRRGTARGRCYHRPSWPRNHARRLRRVAPYRLLSSDTRLATESERRTFMYVLAFAALGIILLVGVGAVFAFGGGGSSNASSRLIQTGSCTEEQFKGLPPAHLQNPDAPVKYNSFPPSSGPHYAAAGSMGRLSGLDQADDPRPQPRARRDRHPVRARGQQGRRRQAAVLRPGRSVRARRRSLREAEGQDRRDGLERARVRPEPGREPRQGRARPRLRPHVLEVRQGRALEVQGQAPQQGAASATRASRT